MTNHQHRDQTLEMREDTRRWIQADQAHAWHPFTRQHEWCAPGSEPLVIVKGDGVWLWDSEGRKYLDGNSSIWTNIHGHSHPTLVAAIQKQAAVLGHSSFLGFTHPLAADLAEALCALLAPSALERVFFSDDGSTAVECALKMALQYRMQTGEPERVQFVAFANGYHGDTLGAASMGGVARFFERFTGCGYAVNFLSTLDDLARLDAKKIAAVIIEPLIQGVNEMRVWPIGFLADLKVWCERHGVHLIADEVMTGFGRTGSMFACQKEQVTPDFLCLAKGLTGGMMPLAATLTTGRIYDAFLGDAEKAFYYGHSYTANPLGCAAALANLTIFREEQTLASLPEKIDHIHHCLTDLKMSHPLVHEVRQCGMIAGIELRRADGEKFAVNERMGEQICHAARAHGLLTRPILDTIVLMPPLSISRAEIDHAFYALHQTLKV